MKMQNPVRILQGARHIVGDHDDRHSLTVQFPYQIIKIPRHEGIQARHRLVQDQQTFRGAQSSGQQNTLLLTPESSL